MNFGFFFLFVFIQFIVNRGLILILGNAIYTIAGALAYYLLSSLIIAFIAAFMQTPKQFRKDFYRQPGFHKIMLSYFGAFLVIDLIFYFI